LNYNYPRVLTVELMHTAATKVINLRRDKVVKLTYH
jgi:hypothetical protein